MNVYYRFYKVGPYVFYELETYYKDYIIALFFVREHSPIKRMTRKNPVKYFRVINSEALRINVLYKEDRDYIKVKEIPVNVSNDELSDLYLRPKIIQTLLSDKEDANQVFSEFLKALSM